MQQDEESQVVDGAFGCGYLVRAGDNTAPPEVARWPVHQEGGLTYHLHPRTRWQRAHGAPGVVLILGHPVDVPAGISDGEEVCRRVVSAWSTGGVDAAVRYLAYLGGRYTAFLHAAAGPGPHVDPPEGEGGARGTATGPREVTVVPDCQATQAVFYSTRRGLALGSQTALPASTVGAAPDEESARMWQELRALRRTGVIFLPGTMTTHEDVLPLIPNHLLRIRLEEGTAQVEQARFWPFEDRVERSDTAAVTREFIDYFTEHTRLLAGFGRTAISLTGGKDSRSTLAGALPHLGPDAFTFTYYNPQSGVRPRDRDAVADLFAANAFSVAVGVQHRALRWQNPPEDGVFEQIVNRTYPVRRGSVGAAHAMWAQLPRDIVQLQSIGAELGTTFYTTRSLGRPLSPRRLMQLVTAKQDPGDELVARAYGDYLDWSEFTEDRIGGYDYHDVFYWEQRMGKWGFLKYQDGDFSHRMLMPFNDRGLIQLMQSLPYPQREEKVLLHALLDTVPALAEPSAEPAPEPDAEPDEELPPPLTWRDVVAARPHLRPRLRRQWRRLRSGRSA